MIHPQMSLPWLPPLLASSFDGDVSNALIATVTLLDTQCTTAQVAAVQWMSLCLGLARVREPTLQHYWYPLPTTSFRWQQLPALETLDHSVPLSMRQHHLQEVSLWLCVHCSNLANSRPAHSDPQVFLFQMVLSFQTMVSYSWTILVNLVSHFSAWLIYLLVVEVLLLVPEGLP